MVCPLPRAGLHHLAVVHHRVPADLRHVLVRVPQVHPRGSGRQQAAGNHSVTMRTQHSVLHAQSAACCACVACCTLCTLHVACCCALHVALRSTQSINTSPLVSHFGETLDGAATIRGFALEEQFKTHNRKCTDFAHRPLYASQVRDAHIVPGLAIDSIVVGPHRAGTRWGCRSVLGGGWTCGSRRSTP